MNQILYTGEPKKKRIVSKKEGMLLISALLVIAVVMIFCLNISSFNITSQAVSQAEEPIEQKSENTIEDNSAVQVVLPEEEEEEEVEEPKNTEPVTQTITGSNGKTYDVIATLKIPSLNIEYPVLSSTSTELMKISLNKYWGANPNEVGNMCIIGHNYEDSRFFGKLNQIKMGAEIYLTDMTGRTLTYKVYHTEVVDPYDTKDTSQLTNGHTDITLITCHDGGATRFIVKARAN